MATSSIFTDFVIKDKQKVRKFVKAIEESLKDPRPKSAKTSCHIVLTPEEIRKRFRKNTES